MFDIDLRPMFSIKWLKILILTVMVMVRVQYCVVKHGFWIQRATPSYFSAFVGRRVCRLLGWSPCRLVGWPAALPAAQKAEWCVHKDDQEVTDWRLEGTDFERVVESCSGYGSWSASKL